MDQLDLNTLKLLEDRATHQQFSRFVTSSVLEDNSRAVVEALGAYYEAMPDVSRVDWAEFGTWLTTVHSPWVKAERKQVYRAMCARLDELTLSPDLYDSLVHALNERNYAAELREIAEDVCEGRGRRSLDEAFKLLTEYKESNPTSSASGLAAYFVDDDLADTITDVNAPGLEWRLEELNVGAGPLRLGDLVLLGARPEAGKTSLVLYNAVYMAAQLPPDRPVIYFCNEEDGRRVRVRAIQAALGVTSAQIRDNANKASEAFYKRVGGPDKFRVLRKRDLHIDEIIAVCEEYNPGLIIVDQLRKCAGFEKAASPTERFQRLFMEARDLACRIAPVIAVHQADQTAEGQMRLRASQLEACKTEIQGEIDLLLMLGCADPSQPSRMLTICKNKLTGGPRSDDTYKHASFPLQFDASRAKYEGTMQQG